MIRSLAATVAASVVVALTACVSAPRDDAWTVTRSGTVEWSAPRGPGRAPIAFSRAANGDVRMEVDQGRVARVRRIGGQWDAAPALADWQAVAEAFEGAAFVPEGESDVRTGRFTVRYLRRDGALVRYELVVIASGARFRVTFPAGPATG